LGAAAPTITNESANDSSPAVSNTAGRRRQQSIASAIKGLFRQAVKAITTPSEEDEPPETKKRRGDTEGEFARQALLFARRSQAARLVRQFAKAARNRLQRRHIIRLTRQAWGPPDAHLQTTLNLFDQPVSGAPHGMRSSPAIRHVTAPQPNRLSPRA
jgi:hypothetical protein